MPLELSPFLTRENRLVDEFIPADKIQGSFQNPDTLGRGAVRVDTTTVGQGSATIASGTFFNLRATLTTNPKIRTVVMPMWSIYVDNDGNSAYLYPQGASLTSTLTPIVSQIVNKELTDFNVGSYVFDISIFNNSGANRTYYVDFQALLLVIPAQALFGTGSTGLS